jgi:ABC-2 type transport system permease protein
MAVRERGYRPYSGPRTDPRWRFLTIPRYAYEDVFKSRRFLVVLVASLVWPVISLLLVYLHHNVEALSVFELQPLELIAIDGKFFEGFYRVQGFASFVIVFLVGPTLISKDLAHNGLPLYLARPFSRAEYVLGKLAVLAILLSIVSWVPGVILLVFQISLAGKDWLLSNWWLIPAVVAAGWVMILFFSLLVLAISAWVRWHVMARGALLGGIVFSAMVAGALSEIFRSDWGQAVDPVSMLGFLWEALFRLEPSLDLPVWVGWTVIGGLCAACLVMLSLRVRAYEVVQ